MRILRVAQKVYPDVNGGGAYHVHAMSRDQAAMGHDVTILTVSDNDDLPREERRDGYRVVRRSPTVNLLGNDISTGVARFLRQANEFDVIHAHSHLYFSTNLAALKRRLGEIPLAITNHGLYSQNAPEWTLDLYLRSVGQWTFNQADVIFCYTDEDCNRVREFGVDSCIEVVANGVDTERFTPEGEVSSRIDHDGSVVLFVGRLVEGKRPLDVVQAVSRLPDDVKLYMVGDGPMRSELEEMASDQVKFIGQVSYEEMPEIYRAGDALILPSRAEGLPRTILEAMASGLPVVSSHLKHIAPVVQKAGKTVPIADIFGYTTALRDVLDWDEGISLDSRRVVLNEFRWQNTVEETTQVLEDITTKIE
ncbi:glycosyltransferase family 4 protein [Halostagnicola kamekurae]|uniref:Glycosyltransferase involved in cell wall bisynthesis n=1 Tax=Halostagnicola kamekurae TaxID=619731 RepID=A0A1I6QMV3_9EURY|nr:glycosyltransferase family 4 protein [Halostagnicola kamekurae]SFS53754.1 Glycosyltransferase involved in cell wall bisynthesis [Halostagnicola kamekurae]